MSGSSDTLQFSLPTHGDAILCKMNVLREENRFCDITLIIGGSSVSAAQTARFHGHRVVLAASSDFLRDQFLLHEEQAELSVGVVSSARVAKTLLLSCYTGLLEVPLRELVSYLVAASALRMSQVVEKCTQALSHCLSSIPVCLKLERHLEDEVKQQLDSGRPSSGSETLGEMDAVPPNIQEPNTKEEGAADQVDQEAEMVADRVGEKTQLGTSEDGAFSPATVESEDGSGTESICNTSAYLKDSPAPHSVSQDPSTGSFGSCEDLVDGVQTQQRQTQEPTTEATLAVRLHGDEAEDPDSPPAQRPYLCRRCDRIFQHLENYMRHLKEHRQHLCLVCGEGFSQRSKLTRHIHVHTGVKLFRCPLCHRQFTQRGALQEHLLLHTRDGSRPGPAHKPGLREHLSGGKPSQQEVPRKAQTQGHQESGTM
ncbi:unnamed protein product [Menidia menidia]|uniref:(Atlantic silverside) hypothetical protein n=1 Tax=Menidia menidia TaxID=238744 RepID=A0A8S4ANR9_9TELE|nr:unnamed protein product [Menidia menidia]